MAENNFDIAAVTKADIEVFGKKGVVDKNKRVVIIGLGGTGTDTLLLTKDTILKRFELKNNQVPDNIELLAIDTDKGILQKNVDGTKLDPTSEFLLLSDNNIAAQLADKSVLPEYFKNWVNPSLTAPHGAGAVGAGAVRQIGRYLLLSNYQKVSRAIHNKIKSVQEASSGGKITEIIILSGISGGTGSGTFIDMGYIIRKVCQDMVINDLDKHITAYLYMPDVNIGNPKVPQSAHEYIRSNGYAALKDLDYFMSITDKETISTGDESLKPYRFVQRMGFGPGDTIIMEKAPFDSTYLISGVPSTINPTNDAYDYAIHISADSIVNFISGVVNSPGVKEAATDVDAVDINGAQMLASGHAVLKRANGTEILGNYKYKTIGANVATLPMKDITAYVAGQFLQKINILKNQSPLAVDFAQFEKVLAWRNIPNNIASKIGAPSFPISGADFIGNPQAVDGQLRKALNKYLSDAKTNMPTLVDLEIDNLKHKIFTQLDTIFVDIEKGPFYTNKILADQKFGLIQKLTGYATSLLTHVGNLQMQQQAMQQQAQEQFNAANSSIFGKQNKYNDYISTMLAIATANLQAEICKLLSDRLNNKGNTLVGKSCLVEELKDRNNNIFSVYTKILTTLSNTFDGHGNKISTRSAGKVFIWDIVELSKVTTEIEAVMSGIDLNKELNNMLDDMVKNSKEWCNNKTVLHQFAGFLSSRFDQILGLSMDEYLKNLSEEQLMDNIERLDRGAQIHFPTTTSAATAANIHDQVTVPHRSERIKNAIYEYMKAKANGGMVNPPAESNLDEKISWIRVNIGVPIFQYAYLQQCETAYLSVKPQLRAGRHLYENTGVKGTDYPALLPKYLRNNHYENLEEDKRLADMESLFDQAVENGMVSCDPTSYFIKITKGNALSDQIDAVLSKYNVKADDIENATITANDIKRCIGELNQIDPKAIAFGKLRIPDTKVADLDITNEVVMNPANLGRAKESFTRMSEARLILVTELDKLTRIDRIKEELAKLTASFNNESEQFIRFINAMYYKVIQKKGKTYLYNNGEEDITLVNSKGNPEWRFTAFNAYMKLIEPFMADKLNDMYDETQTDDDAIENIKKYYSRVLEEVAQDEFLITTSENSVKDFHTKLKLFLTNEISQL